MRRLALMLMLAVPAPAAAQGAETLADIRQSLSALSGEIQSLGRELSTTGAPDPAIRGTTALDRIDAMEAELRRLTARTEELQFRIESVVADGTNRLGDLEFRVCEADPGCDVGSLGETSVLGGEGIAPPVAAEPAPSAPGGGAQLAVGEQAEFDAAREALDQGDFQGAADRLSRFTETYGGGPLTPEAHDLRGDALAGLGDDGAAARAYLDAFSADPAGTRAPGALLKLGLKLEALGQREDACLTLGEVAGRFPGSGPAAEAETARADLACG